MSVEIQYLAWAIVLGVAQLLLADLLVTRQRGMAWNTGNRDQQMAPPAGAAGRSERAFRNFLETFPLLAAAVLALVASGRADATSALGAQVYFWARLAYVPLYLSGVPYLRSTAWTVSMAGFAMVLWPLLR
ncbi:MAPEG family protein [Pseudoxanthomonas sp.]|uniref:MAPEG family protein n=1 Tax=Pseudoxanthomonas sp. TaxID=1871049 RepID=UPI00258C7AE9|nr:MAPEG family protein [Pseudoxanthomonas sp.]MCR6684851.1 MAPEG family protein [Pseudoxanthomonas sp.]